MMKALSVISSLAWLVACSTTSDTQATAPVAPVGNEARTNTEDRLANASDSLRVFRSNIPDEIANRPQCVIVFPQIVTAGFIVGGEGGKGFAACMTDHGWSGPAPLSIGGGTFGAQIGASSAEVLMLAMDDTARRALLKGNFRMGVDASAAAGPVGKGTGVSNGNGGDIVSYSRAQGLFAGAVISGAEISQDDDTTRVLYGTDAPLRMILEGHVPMPADPGAARFTKALQEAFVTPSAPISAR
jgi:lipid-binding SYLF domain-containing protein